MITIKSNSFSDTEKAVLYDLVNEMHVMFIECYCPKFKSETATCDNCNVKHLCYDVEKIKSHTEVLVNEINHSNNSNN